MPDEDAFDLERFVTAQAPVFAAALAELQAGPEAQPLDVVRLPAAARTGPLRDGLRATASARSTRRGPISPTRCSGRG